MYIQSRGRGTPQELGGGGAEIRRRGRQAPGAGRTSRRPSAPACRRCASTSIARRRSCSACRCDVIETLQSTFGALYVNDFNRPAACTTCRCSPSRVPRASRGPARRLRAREVGRLVPLTALANIREVNGPESSSASTCSRRRSCSAAPRRATARARRSRRWKRWRRKCCRRLHARLDGHAYQEKISGGASNGVYLLAVLMVFLILAAQYER